MQEQQINETFVASDFDVPRPKTIFVSLVALKKFFIDTFIGGLIASATVAVVTVLVGSFESDVTFKVFVTLASVMAHSLFSLLFLWDDSRHHTFYRLPFFINTIFFLVVVNFVASLFSIWEILSPDIFGRLYGTYIIFAFAALHMDMLSKALGKEAYLDNIIYANYIFIALVVAMLQPLVYIVEPTRVLNEMYFRFLAAVSIVDGTLSVLTIIFYRLYMQKHPEIKQKELVRTQGLGFWLWMLVAYLVVQVVSSLLYSLFGFVM